MKISVKLMFLFMQLLKQKLNKSLLLFFLFLPVNIAFAENNDFLKLKETKLVDKENKLAISGLEVGDILDFYLFSQEEFKSWGSVGFPKVERVLADVYPVMNYKLTFLSENDFFINFNSYNGAPQLVESKHFTGILA